jgi:hypothetical protein
VAKAVTLNTALSLDSDVDELPSASRGQVFCDIIDPWATAPL